MILETNLKFSIFHVFSDFQGFSMNPFKKEYWYTKDLRSWRLLGSSDANLSEKGKTLFSEGLKVLEGVSKTF